MSRLGGPVQARLLLLVGMLVLWPVTGASAEQCSADCIHQTKACVCALDGRSLEVTPIGGVERRPLEVLQALEPGDEIMSADENAVVSLVCPKGSSVTLHGRFRTLIMPSAASQDCTLNLLAGDADILTEHPTEISSGETVMGSERTMYRMRVSSDAKVECAVFEGKVQVRNVGTGASKPLGSSQKMTWMSGRLLQDVAPLVADDIRNVSDIYSRADVARARAQGVTIDDPDSLRRSLQAGYTDVLTKPDDPSPRIALAEMLTKAMASRHALYQLGRAETLRPARVDQQSAIAATKWQAYKQIGREQEANAEGEKLRRLDPDRYRALRVLDPRKLPLPGPNGPRPAPDVSRPAPDPSRSATNGPRPAPDASRSAPDPSRPAPNGPRPAPDVSPPAGPPAFRIAASARPDDVAAGERTWLVVTARAPDGRPLRGAGVALSAGGGLFVRTNSAKIEGRTADDGVFRAEWRCGPCAPLYSIDVTVTPTQFPAQATKIHVRTH